LNPSLFNHSFHEVVMSRNLWYSTLILFGLAIRSTAILAADTPPPTLTRVFFQDDDAGTIRWADLRQQGDAVELADPQPVPGFPKLDPEEQRLVQMEAAGGLLLVGVRDEQEGKFGSGWILIDTGVAEEEHGDHSHWIYPRVPRVRSVTIDANQGNPAHLYVYEGAFYLANDRRNGYTRLAPADIRPEDDEEIIRRKAVFHAGGGGHITLAASRRWGFATWPDRSGDRKGRVDITPIAAVGTASSGTGAEPSPQQVALSFQLPHGGLHGATICEGKVFFAPSNGICWIREPDALPSSAKEIAIGSISLGTKDDKPRRTGAFTTSGRHVLFVTGGGDDAALCLVDASQPTPTFVRIGLEMADDNRPAGLEVLVRRRGPPLAFVFHDHAIDAKAPNRLTVLQLDPDQNGDWSDVKIDSLVDVGASRVEGHNGHHAIAFDADQRRGVFSNSGGGTLSVLNVVDRRVSGTFKVGGTPSKVVVAGGRARAD
jgi:hypothetical protein